MSIVVSVFLLLALILIYLVIGNWLSHLAAHFDLCHQDAVGSPEFVLFWPILLAIAIPCVLFWVAREIGCWRPKKKNKNFPTATVVDPDRRENP